MIAISAICVTAVFGAMSPVFEVEANSVTVAEGQPVYIDMAVTYRGIRPIRIHAGSYRNPSFVTFLPDEWNPVEKLTNPWSISTGVQRATLWPGDRLERRIDLGKRFDYTAPVGRHVVRVQTAFTLIDEREEKICDVWCLPTDVVVRVHAIRAEGPRDRWPLAASDVSAQSLAAWFERK